MSMVLYLPCNLTFIIIWSFSFPNSFALLIATYRFRMMICFRSGLLLRLFFTGSLSLFLTHPLLQFPCLPLSPEFVNVLFSMCLFENFPCSITQYGVFCPLGVCILLSYVRSSRILKISWCFFSLRILALTS